MVEAARAQAVEWVSVVIPIGIQTFREIREGKAQGRGQVLR